MAEAEEKEIKKLYTVEISENEMEASILISKELAQSDTVTVDSILDELKNYGVKYGIDNDLVNKIVSEKLYNITHIVAIGKKAIIGQDTKKEFFFETKPKKPKPITLPDGSVDHYILDTVEQVPIDHKLAVMAPPTKSVAGITVLGRELRARDGRNFPIRAGQNVRVSEDGLEFYATMAGFPKIIGSKVSVSTQYVVEAHVDFSTGNINFDGDVLVKGDVLDGFKVEATGNIDVMGNIKNSTVIAGGTVNALGGIVSKKTGLVQAGQNINAIFVESGNLEADNNIDVQRAIMHSQIKAGNAIFCESGKGVIVGGEISAGRLVQAKEVGSEYGSKTKIVVGHLVEQKAELVKVSKEIEKTVQNFNKLKDNRQKLSDSIEAVKFIAPIDEAKLRNLNGLLQKVAIAQKGVVEQLRDLKEKQDIIKDQIESNVRPKFSVSGNIFPGVDVMMNGSNYHAEQTLTFTTIYQEKGQIQLTQFSKESKH